MISFKKLSQESGEYHLGYTHGDIVRPIFCFRGSADFLTKTENFLFNYEIIGKRAKIAVIDKDTRFIFYQELIFRRGLKLYYLTEILACEDHKQLASYKESVKYDAEGIATVEETYDHKELDALAEQMAQEFFDKSVRQNEITLKEYRKRESFEHCISEDYFSHGAEEDNTLKFGPRVKNLLLSNFYDQQVSAAV